MSKLFRNRRSTGNLIDHAGFSSLLDPNTDNELEPAAAVSSPPRQLRGRSKSSLLDHHSRSWLSAAENQASARPPTRKLVKDMNGSCRPSSSLEISESERQKDKGILRRQIARLKGLYRRDKDKS
ncbi:hypothetical protein QBC42DRAFT_61948 [Cladorrhinum samala]|uniref:Uncharacterized protein n=1 Tax=Cladorrhinum samala TaxID=585594 RepID=A0AAV9I4T7_9PEZI|nr:hypothetical protein QBC42DRAFT_61948 [Cladorrhinum samala]